MSLFPARLVFLAFIGLTGGIIYNALYLQDLHNTAGPSAIVTPEAASQPAPHELNNDAAPQGAASQGPALAGAPALPPVRTDLATPREQQVPEQLVKAVQRELDARGYNAGPPDGKLRDETRSAISSFEKDHGLTVTGMPADDLLREILLGDAVKSGATTGTLGPRDPDAASTKGSATVRAVQQILADLGYAPGPIDGAVGSATERAISAFQRDRKIVVSGRISPELLGEIKRVTGRDLAEASAAPR
jgi:peptidoglycan hydrolase-like protein with peptidoglycan-binding domain